MRKLFLLLSLVSFGTVFAFAGNKVVAHRGYWKAEGASQNSRASLQKALDLNVYGSEIDIWRTTDGKIMVNHDATFKNVVLQKSTYKQCKKLVLSNGEHMPQLKDMLRIMKTTKSKTKLIIEIKSHEVEEHNRMAARAAMKAVKKYGVVDKVEYISFNLEACKEVAKLDKNARIAYLSSDKSPAELHKLGINGIDYVIHSLREHPEWIQQAHDLGMTVNVWTVNSKKDIEEMNQAGVDYITTDEPVLAAELTR